MKKIIFIAIIFFSIVTIVGTNAYSQPDKYIEKQKNSEAITNFTDQMKFLCIKTEASNGINQIENKEEQTQCKKFLECKHL
jgi:hypothetical protein